MASHPFIIFTLLFITSTSTTSEARDFLVGGNSDAWKIPSPTSPSLNQWAEATRFQIGDSLVWNLKGKKDSVLQVSREDYSTCTISNPIADHRDDTVTVKLEKSGPYYFVSGESGACEKGEKMAVVVMSDQRNRRPRYEFFNAGGPSPAAAPAVIGAEEGPASAPTSGGGRNLVGVLSFAVMLSMGLVL